MTCQHTDGHHTRFVTTCPGCGTTAPATPDITRCGCGTALPDHTATVIAAITTA